MIANPETDSPIIQNYSTLVAGIPLHQHSQIMGPETLQSVQSRRCPGYSVWDVTVTAPAGTLHEAFFDPVTVGTAVKADGSNGVLTPTSFTVGSTATELTSLEWSSNQVVLTLGTHVSLSGYVLDFIALDGSVSPIRVRQSHPIVPLHRQRHGRQHGGNVFVAHDESVRGRMGINSCCASGRTGRTDAFESSLEPIAGPS